MQRERMLARASMQRERMLARTSTQRAHVRINTNIRISTDKRVLCAHCPLCAGATVHACILLHVTHTRPNKVLPCSLPRSPRGRPGVQHARAAGAWPALTNVSSCVRLGAQLGQGVASNLGAEGIAESCPVVASSRTGAQAAPMPPAEGC
eukprot:358566-Chlamydomonas_euryale.AAC.3